MSNILMEERAVHYTVFHLCSSLENYKPLHKYMLHWVYWSQDKWKEKLQS